MEEEMLTASDNNNDAGGDVGQQKDEGGETGLPQDRTPECSGEEEQQQESTDDYEPCDPLIMLNLFQSLSSTTSSLELQIKINKHLRELTGSPCVFLVPILSSSEEGLIQVINDNVLDKEIRFSINSSHLKNASQQNGYPFVIEDLNKDFSEVIEMVVGNKHNTLIFDIKSSRVSKLQTQISTTSASSLNSLPTLASLDGSTTTNNINAQHQQQQQQCNNNGSSNNCSNHSHPQQLQQQQIALFVCIAGDNESRSRYQFYIEDTFRYVLGHLLTAFELFEEKRVRYQCQNLLQVARRLLGNIGDLGQLLRGVMTEAKELTTAERCSLFLLDKATGELVSKVFDGNEASKEIRIESGKGIAGYVAQTGKLLNIRNAYQHPLFYKGVDESTGFKTRNILCFPICDEQGVIGVAQLCNKKLESLTTSRLLQPLDLHTKLIVVFYTTKFESPHRDLIYYFLAKKMFNVVFVLLDQKSGHFKMYTVNFIASRISYYNQTSSTKEMFQDQTSYLRGALVTVEARHNPPYVDFRRQRFQGLDATMTKLILAKLNAEMHLVNSFYAQQRNPTANYSISIARYGSLNTEEFVTAPLPDSFVVLTAPGRFLTIPEIFFSPFSDYVWILLVLLAVLGIVAMWIFPQSFRNDIIMLPVCGLERYNLNDAKVIEKMLLMSLIILIFLTTCAYEAKVMSSLTEWPRTADIKTIDELVKSGRKVCANLEFTPSYIRNDSRLGPILVDIMRAKINLQEYAFLDMRESAKISVKANQIVFESNTLKLVTIEEQFGTTIPLYNFGRRNLLTRNFVRLKQHIFESGLYFYWLEHYETKYVGGRLANLEVSDKDRDDSNVIINVESLRPAWALAAIDWTVCGAVLLFEMCIKRFASGWLKTVGERVVISK